jgi:hypothetical protein
MCNVSSPFDPAATLPSPFLHLVSPLLSESSSPVLPLSSSLPLTAHRTQILSVSEIHHRAMAAPTSPAPARLNPRAAALAAAEARLRPTPVAADTSAGADTASTSASSFAIPASTSSAPPSGAPLSGASSPRSGPGTPTSALRAGSSPGGLFNGGPGLTGTRSPPVVAWTPTEKGDRETRKEFLRLLDRGIVRDNGYRDAAAAVEVSDGECTRSVHSINMRSN